MFKEIKSPVELIRGMINKVITKHRPWDIFIVTSVNTKEYTVNIANFNSPSQQYNDVQVAGLALGNFDGIIKMPKTDDTVLVGYISPMKPIVVSSLFMFKNDKDYDTDNIPSIEEGETLIIGNRKGSYIYFDKNGNVVICGKTIKYKKLT